MTTKTPSVPFIMSLLVGQAFFHGGSLVLIYIAGNTLFLVDYGAEFFPYVYVVTGVFVSLVFFGVAQLQRRWTLAQLVSVALISQAVIFLLARLALMLPDARWVSIIVVILYPLGAPFFGIILGGQAGRLFDLRQMKRLYPILLTAITAGHVATPLGVPLMVEILGSTNDLLPIASGGMLIVLILFGVTIRMFPEQLGQRTQQRAKRSTKSFKLLLRSRYTLNLFTYQILSAFGSQLVLYIFMVQADARFVSEIELANFLGLFTGVRNAIVMVVTMLIIVPLISRFGLGFGLSINPIAITIAVIVMAIGVFIAPPIGALIFWLAVVTYSLDVILTESTSVSIKTANQSLPLEDRSTIETTVEGIGVPAAMGIIGILLLILNAIPSLTITHIISFTAIISFIWISFALLVYRDYASTLLQTLSRRHLGEPELALIDGSTLAAIQSLLQGTNLYEIRLAVDLLERQEHEALIPSLVRLVEHNQAEIRAEALNRIARLQAQDALPVVEKRVELETDPTAKGAAIQALCALAESEAVDLVPDEYLDDPEPDIRLGTMAGLLRYGGISGVLTAGLPLNFLVESFEPEERAFAAQVIGAVGLHGFYHPLLSLLEDEDITVRQSALTAAGQVKHKRLLPLVIESLADMPTRAAAISALISSGTVVLPLVDQALAENELRYSKDILRRLVRVCSQIKGEQVITLLEQHLDYPDPEVHYQILFALNLCNFHISENQQGRFELALRNLAEYGTQVLTTKQLIGPSEDLTSLMGALDAELNQVRQRIFLLLSFAYERLAMLKAEIQIARGSRAEQALAIETLDVTLSKEHRELIVPLIDDSLSLSQRATSLRQIFQLPELSREQLLKEMITDGKRWPQDWTRACAIQASAKLGLSDLSEAIENSLILSDSVVRETAVWALYNLVPARFEQIRSTLAGDTDPQVAHVVNQLS